MQSSIGRRLFVSTLAMAGLAACARPTAIVLDRAAMAGIKRIGLPTVGVNRSPDVLVQNGMSTQMAGFGLIGAIGSLSGMVVRGNRSDAVVRMMAEQGFDPGPALTAMLTSALQEKGLMVSPVPALPKRQFLTEVLPSPNYDAVLDCYISAYGFIALNDSDSSPYRATVSVPARLVGADGTVLMQDTVVTSAGSDAAPVAKPGDPPDTTLAPGTFTSFSDVEKNPAAGVEALRAVFAAAAAGIVRRLT